LLYFPRHDSLGGLYDARIEELQREMSERTTGEVASEEQAQLKEKYEASINQLHGEWKRQSYLGRLGRTVEPLLRPLGWDWRIGMAAIASFPAREVVVGTLGIIYNQGKVDSDELREAESSAATKLGQALKNATWDDRPNQPVFGVP